MIEPAAKAMKIRAIMPNRNHEARRSIWSLGWVMPKVRKKAVARASRNCMVRWYDGGGLRERWGGGVAFGEESLPANVTARIQGGSGASNGLWFRVRLAASDARD